MDSIRNKYVFGLITLLAEDAMVYPLLIKLLHVGK